MRDKEKHSTEKGNTRTVRIRAEVWLALLKIAGHQIDPEKAEVHWSFRQVVDPYGVHSDLQLECDCVGRLYFARSPGSRVWVEFGDLPDATRQALWMRAGRQPSIIDDEVPFKAGATHCSWRLITDLAFGDA
jgi:hypothetical protein